MPFYIQELESTHLTVTREVAFKIAKDLRNYLGIGNNTKILMGSIDSTEDLPVDPTMNNPSINYGKGLVLMEVDERYTVEGLTTNSIGPNSNVPIFLDQDLGVSIEANYFPVELNITLNFRMPDRNAAESMLNDLRYHARLTRNVLLHEVTYKYKIPDITMALLGEIYLKKEVNNPEPEDIKRWFGRCYTDKLEPSSNRSGSEVAAFIRERQRNVYGRLDFSIVPEKPRGDDDEKTAHIVTISYVVTYDKPGVLTVKYPLLANNTPISDRFYDNIEPYNLRRVLMLPSRYQLALEDWGDKSTVTFENGVPVPYCNDWVPNLRPLSHDTLARLVLVATGEPHQKLFNLMELGIIELKGWVFDLLDLKNIFLLNKDFFLIRLFRDQEMLDPKYLSMDEHFNVFYERPLDITKSHFIQITVCTDPIVLGSYNLHKLTDKVDAIRAYISAIAPELLDKLELSASGNRIKTSSLWEVFQLIHQKIKVRHKEKNNDWFLLGSFMIEGITQ